MEDDHVTEVPPWAVDDDDDYGPGPGVSIDADPVNANWIRQLATWRSMDEGDPGKLAQQRDIVARRPSRASVPSQRIAI
jgi:hypothetical protein